MAAHPRSPESRVAMVMNAFDVDFHSACKACGVDPAQLQNAALPETEGSKQKLDALSKRLEVMSTSELNAFCKCRLPVPQDNPDNALGVTASRPKN